MKPDQLRWLVPRIVAVALVLALAVAVLVGVGFWLGRRGRPVREVQTPPIIREKAVVVAGPGQPVYINRPVPYLMPGATRVEYVRVPVEVTKYQDRVVTVTKEVPVPVAQLVERAPQVITTTIGSVQTVGGEWVTPVNPHLVLVQESPGVYVAGQQEGWKVERVETVTALPPAPSARTDRWRVEVYPGLAAQFTPAPNVGPGIAFNVRKDHLVIQGQVGYGIFGPFSGVFVGYGF